MNLSSNAYYIAEAREMTRANREFAKLQQFLYRTERGEVAYWLNQAAFWRKSLNDVPDRESCLGNAYSSIAIARSHRDKQFNG